VKKIYLFIFCIILSIFSIAQNKQQTLSNSFLGNYEGYQESYSMGQVYGRNVIVPGSTYKFKLSVGNKVKLNQVADNGTEVSYSGKYTISSKNNTTTLSCQMIEDAYKYPSKPKFFIIIDKKTNKIICQQDTDHSPSFELRNPGLSNIILVDTSNTVSRKIISNNNLSEKKEIPNGQYIFNYYITDDSGNQHLLSKSRVNINGDNVEMKLIENGAKEVMFKKGKIYWDSGYKKFLFDWDYGKQHSADEMYSPFIIDFDSKQIISPN